MRHITLLLFSFFLISTGILAMQQSCTSFDLEAYHLLNNQIDLQKLHDERQYRLIREFMETAGAFVLEAYLQDGLISRQTLLDIAALTDYLELFYHRHEHSRESLVNALRYALAEESRTRSSSFTMRPQGLNSDEWRSITSEASFHNST